MTTNKTTERMVGADTSPTSSSTPQVDVDAPDMFVLPSHDMPNPTDVNPSNFRVQSVLYSSVEFSVAWGDWAAPEGRVRRLAMRWNGDEKGNPGYPKTFGHPVWFQIPPDLSLTFLRSLLGQEHGNATAIIDALREVVV